MSSDRQRVLTYHERSTHRPGRYAASLGYLDWATQPSPFRLFEGAERLALRRPDDAVLRDRPTYGDLFAAAALPALPGPALLSSLLYHALALSAWKQSGRARWSLPVNPHHRPASSQTTRMKPSFIVKATFISIPRD